MKLDWVKNSQNNSWFDFLKLDLGSAYFVNKMGIYAIWYTNANGGKMIRMSYGDIGEKLRNEKSNPEVLKYSTLGQLKVTWALCSSLSASAFLTFLINRYSPILGDSTAPNAQSIEVNLIGE